MQVGEAGVIADAVSHLKRVAQAIEALHQAAVLQRRPADSDAWRQKIFDAATLQTMTFAPLKFILPGFVPEGATLLVSRPKLGKSGSYSTLHSLPRRNGSHSARSSHRPARFSISRSKMVDVGCKVG